MAKTQTPMLEAKGFLLGRLKGFVFYSHSHGVRRRTRDAEEEKGRGVRSRSRYAEELGGAS